MAHLTSLATAVPPYRYEQDAICTMLYGADAPERLRSLYRNTAIRTRHSVLEDPRILLTNPGTQARNARYLKEAPVLARRAAEACLERRGIGPQDIDALVVVSCTGYEIPGLDLLLAGEMGMRPDVRRTCVLGMGCYAAFPGLNRARDAVLAHPGSRSLVVAVEICSLHLQLDLREDNLVSTALFADGAAAALLEGEGGVEILGARTLTQYDTASHMAFSLTDHGMAMALSSYVPRILSARVEELVEGLLAPHGLTARDIRHWGLHPGGRKILDHLQERLQLSDAQLIPARRVLRDYGNMSSPTVLFVLEEVARVARPGDHAVLMAFGPGLTLESCLLRFGPNQNLSAI